MPESMAETVGGKIFAYGSYRLGVHNKVALDEFFKLSPLGINGRFWKVDQKLYFLDRNQNKLFQ